MTRGWLAAVLLAVSGCRALVAELEQLPAEP